jgi:hypothetical protein
VQRCQRTQLNPHLTPLCRPHEGVIHFFHTLSQARRKHRVQHTHRHADTHAHRVNGLLTGTTAHGEATRANAHVESAVGDGRRRVVARRHGRGIALEL